MNATRHTIGDPSCSHSIERQPPHAPGIDSGYPNSNGLKTLIAAASACAAESTRTALS